MAFSSYRKSKAGQKDDRHFYYERAIRRGCGPRELLDDWWEEGVEELNLVQEPPKVFVCSALVFEGNILNPPEIFRG